MNLMEHGLAPKEAQGRQGPVHERGNGSRLATSFVLDL